ncbi:putative drug/metabolite transporter 3 [Thermococcus cleftensis]|uniref:Drug/metabolite transporter 3 n=1 Tax=Thermococcus cleftensis (strain DSM 27260 / KACC 17922 / CL1) TaxID=163003 RepID=I3ZTT0_THECF|nr:EamA family transporter [Thermococcus cleftensis]AFL95114.1 putative drug/metabolite transporter 3 [Thermococcus cleftensis]
MKRGYLLVFLAASTWGTLGIFAKYLDGFGLSPFTMVFYRVLFAILLLGTYLRLRGIGFSLERSRLKFYALYGFFSIFLFYTLYFYTVTISSVSFAVLLLYTAPIYSMIMGRLIFGEPLRGEKLIALAMVILGVLLVNGSGTEFSAKALLFGLLTGFTYALYGVLAKFAVRKEEPEKALFYTLLFGLVFLLPFTDFDVPVGAIPYLFALALFPTFLGYILYNHALREVEVSRASIVATIEPVVAIALAFLLFGERLSAEQLIGAALIIGGSVLVHVKEGEKSGKAS